MIPILLCDGYKVSHREQYPENTTLVYSNWTPRSSRIVGLDRVVFFGLQYFIKEYLINRFNDDFFARPKRDIVEEYRNFLKSYLGRDVKTDHIESLHDLGYLPIKICAVEEGTSVKIRNPMMTIWNTHPDFYWLTNSLETLLSNILWMPCTSATIAKEYRVVLSEYSELTGGSKDFIPYQAHDFSMRGMSSIESACLSGAGHLTSFIGTDTIPAIDWIQAYYGGKGIIGSSVPATEHSVMCMGTQDGELNTFRRLLDIYRDGIISIVSDTWDFWKVITEFLPQIKNEILGRNGKVVIRPDSGDPADIICGPRDPSDNSPQSKGAIQCLWEIFGGTTNSLGYKTLDPHIGLIYGDSITLSRQKDILYRLQQKGFASDNIVFGVGSFTYQFNTRDTFGFAMKATYGEINGVGQNIFKDPKTDDGTKKSAKGLLRLEGDTLYEEVSWESQGGDLEPVFCDGVLLRDHSFDEIRERVLRVV